MKKIERKILASMPVSFLREKSKKLLIPGFHDLPLYDVYRFFLEQIKREGLNVRAAAISFNFIMAIPAAMIFLCTLIPYLPISNGIHNELLRIAKDLTPNSDSQKMITDFIDDFFDNRKTGLLSIGFVLAIFYSSNAMMGVIRAFDQSLIEKHRSNFIHKRLRALKLTIILMLLIIGTTLISLGQGALFPLLMKWMNIKAVQTKSWIQSLRWIVVIALILYSVAFIYKYAPSVQKRWKLLSPGSIFATFLIIMATWLFSIWAQNFSTYSKFYGSIGAVLMMMLLVFINSLVLLIGYELNVSITYLKASVDERLKKELGSEKFLIN